jgi:hypothetical protein
VAFLKALVALQKNAKQLGANAVANISNYYKNDTLWSATEFECHAGVSAHVMLKGDFVKIADKYSLGVMFHGLSALIKKFIFGSSTLRGAMQ